MVRCRNTHKERIEMSSRKPESNKIINTSNSNNDNKIKLKVTKKSFNIITEIKSGSIQELNKSCDYEENLIAIINLPRKRCVKVFDSKTKTGFKNTVRVMTEFELRRARGEKIEIIYYEVIK